MSKGNNKNKGKTATSVNPQGYGADTEFAQEPKSKLENATKKANRK
ncbi:small, acid-soluble spore protein L [Rossellomorea aquimaris]|nr:small, acid-soluble spore protein L [Rossellomorea aquimaris]MCA1054575.1 small, acid-soluble spore protein L [Rossellomorea aquimaris]